jgi:hypothetical protein
LLSDAALRLGFESDAECLSALGAGDCQIVDLLRELLPVARETGGELSGPSQMSLIDDVADGATRKKSFHIEMLADDRSGLLMDITSFLGARGIMLLSNSGRVLPGSGEALITIEVEQDDLIEVHTLMDALEMIPAVRTARLITTEVL